MKDRTQIIHLFDKANNSSSDLCLEQSVPFKRVKINLEPSIKYQLVKGFGGMYNPVIWCGGFLINNTEMEKMYGKDGLGYSILRLMIYPNKEDWKCDVEAAQIAQNN